MRLTVLGRSREGDETAYDLVLVNPVTTSAAADPLIGVLAVQGDVREHLEALRVVGARVRAVRRPEELAGVEGLVIPGGESTVMDKLVRAFGLMDPIRAALREGLPAYGSCAGMIMLADRLTDAAAEQRTLGGLDITVRRNAFGRQVDSFEADVDVPVLGETPVRAIFIRAPWVESWGTSVEVLAAVEREGRSHPVAIRQGSMLATSFHPEVTGDRRFHQLFVQMVRARSA